MMLKPGTYLQDRYEILSLIGTGGMSEVYQAKCHTLNRLVAIKVLKDEYSRMRISSANSRWRRRRRQGFPIQIL
ncbi:hypothetical protein [Clostridium sp. AF50-3]|uniref:hypothetical protein n=1 Tax=unclassified Clostridium TaxID=2614128 RepID=UPI0026CA7108